MSPTTVDLGPDCAWLIATFNRCFADSERTVLVGGAAEPFYRAWHGDELAQVIFTRDYRSSALHEIAHWCIAGRERRQLDDFGYWYAPDGRDADQQRAFEQVEVRPQAIEWAFHLRCGWTFHLSADNLSMDDGVSEIFARDVSTASQHMASQDSWPPRARILLDALGDHPLRSKYFSVQGLLDT